MNKVTNFTSSPTTVTGAFATLLETVSTNLGYPGVGSAISLILTSIFGRKLDKWIGSDKVRQ